MSTVQRWLSALGDSADRGVSATRGAGRLDRGADRTDHRGATVGGDRRHRVVRPGTRGRHGVVRLGAGDVAGLMCPRRARAGDGRREPRGRAGAAVEPVARPGALLVRRGAPARRRRRPGGRALRGVRRAGRRGRQPMRSCSASPSSRCWPWIAVDGRRRPSTSSGARRRRRAPDARLRHERARLRRRRPARRAARRPGGGEPPAHPGDARPPVVHVRAALPRRPGPTAAGQGVLGHRRPHDRSPPAA